MANYRKQFNFRNGVQVDDDNLVVSPTGLVGIGTTIPTELLDVRGDVKVSGALTATTLRGQGLEISGTATIESLALNQSITGSGVSVGAGIITATDPTGVVTYYGDGGRLLNLPTSQWLDVDVGLGFTSIYNIGYVGVSTDDPRFSLQIGGSNDPSNLSHGVGIHSSGDILATGIVTATKFIGIGSDLTLLDGSNIGLGTVSNDRLPVLLNSKMPADISVSGIITASSGFVGDVTGNLTGNVTGNVVGILTGDVTGTASTALSLSGTPDITVGLTTTGNLSAQNIGGVAIGVTEIATVRLNVTGISTSEELVVGSGTTTVYISSTGNIGIGSTLPTKPLEIISTGISEIELVGSESRIVLAERKPTGIGIGDSAGVIRFGNGFKNFELLNFDSGDFNCYIHAGAAGIDTGAFRWVYGQDNSTRMSLTYDGNLGIGITDPTDALHVVGTSTFTGAANFASDVTITGSLNVTSITLPSIISSNINATSGVSTFNDIKTIGNVIVGSGQSVGIGSEYPRFEIDASGKDGVFGKIGIGLSYIDDNGNYINDVAATLQNAGESILSGGVGIGTIDSNKFLGSSDSSSSFDSRTTREANLKVFGSFDIENGEASFVNTPIIGDELTRLGIGTADPRSVADFSRAGYLIPNKIASFMILPRVTGAERVGLQTVEGAVIFNTSDSKFQGFDGTTWHDLH